jgi:hypothetical protein
MNYLYLDSSALVKRYSRETGIELVNEICQRKDTRLILSDIAIVELGSAFARKLRERIITEVEYATILNDFMDDYFHEYIRVAIDFEVLELAVKLAKKNALKAYDAVQLAYTYPRKLGHKLRWILRYNILYLYLKLVEEIYVSKTSKS